MGKNDWNLIAVIVISIIIFPVCGYMFYWTDKSMNSSFAYMSPERFYKQEDVKELIAENKQFTHDVGMTFFDIPIESPDYCNKVENQYNFIRCNNGKLKGVWFGQKINLSPAQIDGRPALYMKTNQMNIEEYSLFKEKVICCINQYYGKSLAQDSRTLLKARRYDNTICHVWVNEHGTVTLFNEHLKDNHYRVQVNFESRHKWPENFSNKVTIPCANCRKE